MKNKTVKFTFPWIWGVKVNVISPGPYDFMRKFAWISMWTHHYASLRDKLFYRKQKAQYLRTFLCPWQPAGSMEHVSTQNISASEGFWFPQNNPVCQKSCCYHFGISQEFVLIYTVLFSLYLFLTLLQVMAVSLPHAQYFNHALCFFFK